METYNNVTDVLQNETHASLTNKREPKNGESSTTSDEDANYAVRENHEIAWLFKTCLNFVLSVRIVRMALDICTIS